MLNHNWMMLSSVLFVWLLICCHHLCINGQIGALHAFQKTSFSCAGRPAGYYADLETGCQTYHMCDGLGRQFSYACPNTTLFQQRMLICDHWYMVNCSKAEDDYSANLLIGQRDKPFVTDKEFLRTPRPDLLDRPYAPDYSGESFRNQYKKLPAIQNQIKDSDVQKNADKTLTVNQPNIGQQHWKIPPPSRTILPPAYESQTQEEVPQQSVRFVSTTAQPTTRYYSKPTAPVRRTAPTSTTTTTQTTSSANNRQTAANNRFNSAALHQRQQESLHDDLGTSHSTRYNTSADFNSAEVYSNKYFDSRKTTASTTNTAAITDKDSIKVPSKIYEPPFLYPIYNQNDSTSVTETPLRVSTATPFTVRTTTTTTTSRPPSRPTTMAGKPFSLTVTAAPNVGRNQNNLVQQSFGSQNSRFDFQKSTKDIRTTAPAQGFKPPTPLPPVSSTAATAAPRVDIEASPFDYKVPSISFNIGSAPETSLPNKMLLPPFQDFPQHDIATTQGPPIYYEWKIPSNGLEPPKLEPPIGVDGREYEKDIIDYNSISASGGFTTPSTTTAGQRPISRSIKETGQPNGIGTSARKSNTRTTQQQQQQQRDSKVTPTANTDIMQIRKDWSVPEYAFPLENIGRTGYLDTDTYNSFQLKIPERRIDTNTDAQHWFGENPKCPECHPSYVVPGTCEPCLRR